MESFPDASVLISFTNFDDMAWEADLIDPSDCGRLIAFPPLVEVVDDWKRRQ